MFPKNEVCNCNTIKVSGQAWARGISGPRLNIIGKSGHKSGN